LKREKEAGHRRHDEAGRALAVDERRDALGPRLLQHGLDGGGMVVDGGLVQVPAVGRMHDAGPPVLQPDVVAVLDEAVHDVGRHRGPEDVGADAGAVDEQDGPMRRAALAPDVDQVAREAVAGGKGDGALADRAHGATR
jgi:hypothetical protein